VSLLEEVAERHPALGHQERAVQVLHLVMIAARDGGVQQQQPQRGHRGGDDCPAARHRAAH
jgi:hypothetical protein